MTELLGGIVTAAATLVIAALVVMCWQMIVIQRVIPVAEAPPPRSGGLYGRKFPGRALIMVVLGDSFAAGYGTRRARETPGALLSVGVSRRLGRPVELHPIAVVGAMSAGLRHQVDAALHFRPDVAVIFIGGNDVTQLTGPGKAVRHLGDAVRRLRAAGCAVVVGTCPDLGAVPPLRPPLRWLAQALSRRLAAGQAIVVRHAGGITVPLADLLNPAFEADATRLFGADRFHPSPDGYALAAAVTLPVLVATLRAEGRADANVGS